MKKITPEDLEKEYQLGLTAGMFIGGISIGCFMFLLMYLFPLCR